ncbi:Protein SMG7 [Talaromyces islandicus]|uniref:Protein SMG7 n=1 Tax=Talaromyces islandicus TaxID=28573 RepID=A0A0U1LV63_TALIS|nr:Protein SMG7 [Talaromyces islandicus]
MAAAFKNAWQCADQAEKELLKTLADKEPTFAEITHCLNEFRQACQNAIFVDFDAAALKNAEPRLWDAHVKINARFRKILARFRESTGNKKKPVERRKLEKHYLEFIKSSQKFYRGYIQHLSSHFGGVPELEQVARKFNFDNLSVDSPINLDPSLRQRILLSCHATLIRLGDLSRYRETEIVTGKPRNWGPAIGYYDLASVIHPASGASHNQLAVIALADGNHLRATYHLYRALSAQEPHPTSKGNLEIELRKILSAWAKRELIPREDAGIPGKALTPWFVYLHAQCYKGLDFTEHDELENEVLSQLAVDLKERSLEGALQKFVLINIAAEDFATTRSNNGESTHNAALFFQRINVKTFFTLLQILLGELERFATEDMESKESSTGSDKVTVVARRVLPALRNYSSWLLANCSSLTDQKQDKDTVLSVQIKEFWKIYANTLSLLASTFDVTALPEVEYLLEEDEEALGFKPLMNEATSRRYHLESTARAKPRTIDPGVERNHPNLEMLYRIREFVIDGLDLVVGNRIPIALIDENERKMFVYKEEGLPSQFYSSPQGQQPAMSATSIQREEITGAPTTEKNAETRSAFGGSQSASVAMSANFNRIAESVERLVESDTYEAPPAVSRLPEFLQSSQGLLPRSSDTNPQHTIPEPRSMQTHIAPPGLGLRPQSYSPFFTGSSIWSSGPGFSSFPEENAQQEPSASYLALRDQFTQRQKDLQDQSSQLPSSWASSIPSSLPNRNYRASYYDFPHQQHATSGGFEYPSSHNYGFIASSNNVPPGFTPFSTPSEHKTSQESAARFGAMENHTPPCGQAG